MPVTNTELAKKVAEIEHKLAVHEEAFSQLIPNFARYWIDDNKDPGFAVVLSRYDKKVEGVTQHLADLVVFSPNLSAVDCKIGKPLITSEDQPKRGCWEPLVLPLDMIAILVSKKAEAALTDGSELFGPDAKSEE